MFRNTPGVPKNEGGLVLTKMIMMKSIVTDGLNEPSHVKRIILGYRQGNTATEASRLEA